VRRACACRQAICSVKMPLLQLTKLSKIIAANLRSPPAANRRLNPRPTGHILPVPSSAPNVRLVSLTHACRMNRGWRGNNESLRRTGCLASLWPSGHSATTKDRGPVGGNAKYNGSVKACQTVSGQDFTPFRPPGKGRRKGGNWPRKQPRTTSRRNRNRNRPLESGQAWLAGYLESVPPCRSSQR
jgi:hypothetical protein